jgi:DNA replication protein DnaC
MNDDMTPIGDLVNAARDRIRESAKTSVPDCTRHPGNPQPTCEACAQEDAAERAEHLRQAADESHTEALSIGHETCDKRFPLRYQAAVASDPQVLAWVAEFLHGPSSARSLLLLGPTGTGKTWQAYGAIRALADHPLPTRAGSYRPIRWEGGTFADVMASMRPRLNIDTEEELRRKRELDLLLVDDIGASKASEWVEETTYRLINGRYEAMRPSIFVSNMPPEEFRTAVGDRIASRLAETCLRVTLRGPDRRRKPAA